MKYTKPLALTVSALLLSAGLSAQIASAQSASAPELVIENFVGTINWSNDKNTIQIVEQNNMKGVSVSKGGSFIIDGGIETPDGKKCEGYYGNYNLTIFKKKREGSFGGYKDLEDYPVISIAVPTNTRLTIRNAIVFTEGTPNITSADLALTQCGKINLGDISESIELESQGAADLTFLNATSLTAEISGSTDVNAQKIGVLRSEVRGSGDITVSEVDSLDAQISGSGDLEIDSLIGDARIQSAGSGDVDLGRVSGELDYQGAGSGDLTVDEIGATGSKSTSLKSAGSGDIDIDSGAISYLTINTSGSSNANIDAIVETVIAVASGSSEIYIEEVTGSADQRSSGSANIKIANRN